jgi:hypothetical protein
MPDEFPYDVFPSHSAKDKRSKPPTLMHDTGGNPVVRDVAERRRNDGLRVWFDECEIRPGGSIESPIEDCEDRVRAGALPRARALHVGECVRFGLGAVGVRDFPLLRPAEQGAPPRQREPVRSARPRAGRLAQRWRQAAHPRHHAIGRKRAVLRAPRSLNPGH